MLAGIETFLFAAETVGGDVSADSVDGDGNPVARNPQAADGYTW